jgi:hypothetical protein
MVEFIFDANECIPVEPEFAPRESLRELPSILPIRSVYFVLPSPEQAAAAKKAWLPIIRRCTETVSERRGHLRPSDATQPNRGRIHIQYERRHGYGTVSGYEIDISDKMCLLLFSRDEPERSGATKNGVIESSTPILWTEIANIRFEVERPLLSTPHSANAS